MFDDTEIEAALDFTEKAAKKILEQTDIIKIIAKMHWEYYKELQKAGFAKGAAFELTKAFKNPIEAK